MRWTDSWKRFFLHLGIGGFAAWLTHTEPVTGVAFWISFLAYEVVQDWRKQDAAYKDLIGALTLYGIVAGILAVLG